MFLKKENKLFLKTFLKIIFLYLLLHVFFFIFRDRKKTWYIKYMKHIYIKYFANNYININRNINKKTIKFINKISISNSITSNNNSNTFNDSKLSINQPLRFRGDVIKSSPIINVSNNNIDKQTDVVDYDNKELINKNNSLINTTNSVVKNHDESDVYKINNKTENDEFIESFKQNNNNNNNNITNNKEDFEYKNDSSSSSSTELSDSFLKDYFWYVEETQNEARRKTLRDAFKANKRRRFRRKKYNKDQSFKNPPQIMQKTNNGKIILKDFVKTHYQNQ